MGERKLAAALRTCRTRSVTQSSLAKAVGGVLVPGTKEPHARPSAGRHKLEIVSWRWERGTPIEPSTTGEEVWS